MKDSRSLNRIQVEQSLAQIGTSLESFVEAGRKQGKTLEETWMDLRKTTGVPFAVRTFYRWVETLEKVS